MNDFLQNIRNEARTVAENALLPDRLNEDWRDGHPSRLAAALAEALAEGPKGVLHVEVKGVGEGVRVTPLADADLSGKPWEVRSIGSEKLAALHRMHAADGLVVEIAPGVQLDDPLVITYETEGRSLPYTLVMAGEGSRAAVEERLITRNGGLMAAVRRVCVEKEASLSYRSDQLGSEKSEAFVIGDYTLEARAELRLLSRHENALWAREETTVELRGEDARADIFSANSLGGRQVLDQRTRQLHPVPHAASNLLYKNVLDGKAEAVYAGMILVCPGAHGSDAYQSNRNLMLSEDAEIHSMPGLEILADDVRCSHGSATGSLDTEELFYMMSRGVPADEARKLAAAGFLQEVTEQFLGERSDAQSTIES